MKKVFIFIFLCFVVVSLYAQSGSLLSIRAGFDSVFEEEQELFDPGYNIDARVYFFSKPNALFQFGGGINYEYLPLQVDDSVSTLEIGGISSLFIPLGQRMNIRFDAFAGINGGIINSVITQSHSDYGDSAPYGVSFAARGDLLFNWYIKPDISLNADVGIRYVYDLFTSVNVGVGLAFHVPLSSAQMSLTEIKSAPILPAFKEYYLENPVVRIDLKNEERFEAYNVSARIIAGNVNEEGSWYYADSIKSGGTESVYLPVVWKESIMNNSNTSTESLQIEIRYKVGGTKRSVNRSVDCIILGHNAFAWQTAGKTDDEFLDYVLTANDGKVAVFVNPSDENMISLSHEIEKSASETISYDGLPHSMRMIFSTSAFFKSRGIKYQVDPDSVPYGTSSGKTDFVRYPSETLACGYGDCDDLSILAASILKASGVSVAFITVPGHIFIAVESGLDAKSLVNIFGDTSSFILYNDKYWIPFETTIVDKGTLTAWSAGLSYWQKTSIEDRDFYILDDAWQEFRPSLIKWKEDSTVYAPYSPLSNNVSKMRHEIAEMFLKKERTNSAKRISNAASESKGNEYCHMAYVCMIFGELNEAQQNIRQAILYNPSYNNYYNAGVIAYRMGDFLETSKMVNIALSKKDTEKGHALLALVNGNAERRDYRLADSGNTDDTKRAEKAEDEISWE